MSANKELERDIEKSNADSYLYNTSVDVFAWHHVSSIVKDRQSKQQKSLLDNVSGAVFAGEVVAVMGPSGSGKTTLLNILAQRGGSSSSSSDQTFVNGRHLRQSTFRKISAFVEQEDALIGALTVRETIDFHSQLSLPSTVSKKERQDRTENLIEAFGLRNQTHTLIGTPLRKGISGGQKRRVSVASQVIAGPKILFLDEPTSGLDATASYEVMSFLKGIARRYKLLVVASIHQPSTSTFGLFDKLLLLSQGRTCYFGPVPHVASYFGSIGFKMPTRINPAEYLLEITNTDFSRDSIQAQAQLDRIHEAWKYQAKSFAEHRSASRSHELTGSQSGPNTFIITMVLLKRLFVKSYRDVVAYGIRLFMYIGLAIMIGTVWLRLPMTQESIQPFINAIFFGSAFMSFMAVAYVPAYLEDRATFVKDRANGLYGATPFLIANFLIGLPYLFVISVVFSIIAYWLSNFRPDASAFMTWIMWLFLDLLAAESLVVLVSSIFPIFVLSLAIVAFANGLWMSVGGFLVTPTILNVFWKYVFHYIDYQTYVFQGMMVNEFSQRNYTCGTDCKCMYDTELAPQCLIAGTGVLETYGYNTDKIGQWVGILISITIVYRLLGWLALHFRQ